MYGERQLEDGLLMAEDLAMVAEQAGGVCRIDVSHPWRQLDECLMRK